MEERISVFYDPKILYHNTGTGFFEAEASPFLEIKENHPENADRILNFLSVLKQGPISKFVDSDKIYVMDKGEVMDSGNHEELLIKSDTYKNFYEKQLRKD